MTTTRKLKKLALDPSIESNRASEAGIDAPKGSSTDTTQSPPTTYEYSGQISFWRMTGAIITAWAIVTLLPIAIIVAGIVILAHNIH
jgi:hypothetical protein